MSTSTAQDAWLIGLLTGFDMASRRAAAPDAQLLADVERHLRENARAMEVVSQALH